MPKAGRVAVVTSRRACGEVAAWLRQGYRAASPTLLGGANDSSQRDELIHVLTKAARRARPANLALAVDRGAAQWLVIRAEVDALFGTREMPAVAAGLAAAFAEAMRRKHGGSNKLSRGRVQEELLYVRQYREEAAGRPYLSVPKSRQQLLVLRRRERLNAWHDRAEAAGATLLTYDEPLA